MKTRKKAHPLFRPLGMADGSVTAANDGRRTCGGCTACCVGLHVEALNKPPGLPCPHLRMEPNRPAAGCGIYPTRPGVCREYACLWLTGLLPAEMRPTEVGYIVSPNWSADHIRVNELREGATDDCPHFQQWAVELAREGIEICIVPPPSLSRPASETEDPP